MCGSFGKERTLSSGNKNDFGSFKEDASLEFSELNFHRGTSVVEDTTKAMSKLYRLNAFMEWYMRYFPAPFGSYSKETSLLLGLTKYNAFVMRRGDKTDSITQPSSVSALAYYTLNTQHKFIVESNLMLNKNKALWRSFIVNSYYPLLFYGTGNDTELMNESTLISSDLEFMTQYLFRIHKKLYLGPLVDYHHYYEVTYEKGALLKSSDSTLLSTDQGLQSALGLRLSMEGRNNRLNAKKGFFVDASYQWFNKAFGGKFNYRYFQADVRYYFTPFKKLTIATQVRMESKNGHVPIQSLALLGGDYAMRGLYLGRYRDHVLLDSQVEMRFPIFWIIGGTVFGGLGQVASHYQEVKMNAFHAAGGFGLRLKVDSVHDINLRLDVGFSKDQSMIIMNFAEAF